MGGQNHVGRESAAASLQANTEEDRNLRQKNPPRGKAEAQEPFPPGGLLKYSTPERDAEEIILLRGCVQGPEWKANLKFGASGFQEREGIQSF